VRDRLVEACQQLGVRFVYNASVEALQPPETAAAAADVAGSLQEAQRPSSSSSSSWSVVLASGAKVSAERVIFSTGGPRHAFAMSQMLICCVCLDAGWAVVLHLCVVPVGCRNNRFS
jgi:hypothetical protein